jgi:ribosomal protein L40E
MMEDIPIYKVNNTTVVVSTDFGVDLSWLGNISAGTIITVLAILLFLVILVLLWRWRRLKIAPAGPTVPCDGKTPLPIRVMLVNGFGLKRKPRTNMDVDMEATSGSIQNVVLPISKDSVEAVLVPSREFGPVTVTAKAGKKKARAAVSFVCDGGSLDISASPETIPASSDASANVRIRVRDRNGNYVAPLQDMMVGLTSTLGSIAGSVKIPARSTEAYTVIKAGDKSGTAVIRASGGLLTGEGRVNFQGTARRFCMHCGATMTMEAAKCPKCGQVPPSGVDVKQCPTCGTVIPATAMYCHSCGVAQ